MPESKRTVVVVEDDAGVSKALERLLNAEGFRVETFSSAELLLASGTAREAACLILDVNLPGLSGFDLCKRLVATDACRPAIFITAYDTPAYRREAQDARAVAFFTKPVSGRRLVGAIREACRLP